ncbi:SWFGD domain-containing protein [Sphingomicrobium sediminis]|uniref:DUF2171 domain-containing protein n=1 Tax=Sphingomicrobium sediminis TaxID=2950949 RepID=A0A9X2EET3_9SPHN|nr:SWFGD domain-containing protein [Sphingomicrobium sediminis]MCM8556280.1 DUF2171 domain-containing protein [Sphingomicrobium sediminis]
MRTRPTGRFEGRNYGRRPQQMRGDYGYERSERDFFDRAGDEVLSWFGDDEAARRRELDERYGYTGDGYKNQHFEFENGRNVSEGYRRPYDSEDRFSRSNSEMNERGYDRVDAYDYDRGYTQNRWGRPQTQSEFTTDENYSQWRARQIDALDRDYREWRLENQERFNDEFASWRESRENMRVRLNQLDDNATLVASDGETIGNIDTVIGDRIVVKNDSDNDQRGMFSLRNVETIEQGQVKLNLDSELAKSRLFDKREFDRNTMREQRISNNY